MARFGALGWERVAVALVPAGVGAALLYTVAIGLGLGSLVSICLSLAIALAGAVWLSARLPSDINGAVRTCTLLAVLWSVVGIGAVGATVRLAVFISDESRSEYSMFPFDEFFVHHSCLSAYFEAGRLQRAGVPNVYERTLYEGPNGEPRFMGNLVVDTFLYPPPFLLLPRLGLAISENLAAWRADWFGLEGTLVVSAFLGMAFWIGGPVGHRAAWLTPLIWLAFPTLITLQFGNFHLVAIAGSVLAMLAFERGRNALGGGMLAALALCKIFPGILVLLLLFQRRWRSAAWTAGFGVFFLVLSYAVLGRAPFEALVSYHLPRMSSGAAVETQFVHPDGIAANHSVFGLVQKLSLLGIPGMSQGTAMVVTWIYTFALIGLAALAARTLARDHTPDIKLRSALVWLALLQLASLRAPFTPDTYAQFAPLWILLLLLASVEWRGWRPFALAALLLFANFMVPTVEIMPLPALLVLTLCLQLLLFTLCLWTVQIGRSSSWTIADQHG